MAGITEDIDTRALLHASADRSNGVMSQNIDNNEPLERLAPRVTSGRAIDAARQIVTSNARVSAVGQHHRSLSEGSSVEPNYHTHDSSKPFTEEDGGRMFQALPPYSGSELGAVNTRSSSPERDLDESEQRRRLIKNHKISVPERRSSRSRTNSPGNRRDGAHLDVEDSIPTPRHTPRLEEIEAARRILAEAEKNGYQSPTKKNKSSRRTGRATPPPIGRGRIYINDDFEDLHNPKENRPPTPEAVMASQDEPPLRPLSRSYSRTRVLAPQPRSARRSRSQHEEPRSPVLNHFQLFENSTHIPAGARNGRRQRTRSDASEVLDNGFDGPNRTFLRSGTSVSGTEDRALLNNTSINEDAEDRPSVRNGSLAANSEDRTLQRNGNSGARSTFSDEAHSFSRRNVTAGAQSIRSNASSSRLPDFFSYTIFQIVLRNPTTAHQLLKFSETRLCSENIEFLSKVEEYQKILTDLANVIATIHKGFISDQSPNQINLADNVLKSVHAEMKSLVGTTFPGMETLFAAAQERIEEIVFTDVYQRFVRFQITLSATRALASDRHRYQGLGDCFCLTNPNKADNPIVFASDGFVKVTGYGRPEIIPRNCRFLQGSHTDRVPIRRLKKGIDECKETVELILNYKKNGDPFWNLLYVAPLYNENGNVAFFIGGQVNCSTTIHSNVDVMRVLSMSSSSEAEDETKLAAAPAHAKQSALPSARKALLKAFGVRVEEPRPMLGVSGMERQVLDRMEGQNLDRQMKEFYTAYSKYLVVQADTFVIQFYSDGVVDALNPANNTGLVVGQDVFRFFKQNMVGKESDYRTRVRSAIRMGNPISLELRLQTLRSAKFRGDERFITHWTPLKDDVAASHWVVVTLAATMG